MSEPQRVDLVLVGAGMVGSLFLLRLLQDRALAGRRIAVIEAADTAPPAPDAPYALRVSSLSPHSEALIRAVGCGEALRSQRHCAFTDMVVWDADGTGRVHFRAADVGEPHLGLLMENDRIQGVLQAALWALPQVLRHCPDRLQALQRTAAGWRLQTRSGAVLEAPCVVAADGALSPTRELAGIGHAVWDYGQQGLVATVRCAHPHEHTAWQRFLSTGPLAFLPLADPHLVSIVWTLPTAEARRWREAPEVDFERALAQAFEHRLGEVRLLSERVCFPLLARHADRYERQGLVLLGDAAHAIHPLAGQGVNLGFQDAEVLAREMCQAEAAGLGFTHERALRRYSRARRAHNGLFMHSMTALDWLFGHDNSWLRLVRNAGLSGFNALAPVKRLVMRQALGR